MAELALQPEQSETTLRDALVNCLEEADRIHAMLNTLMDISEAEHGAMKLEIQPLNVQDLVMQSIELYREVAEDKAIQLLASVPPELSLYADRNRMLQSLANLLDNAIKYTPSGGQVTMTAARDDHHIVLTVTDTGIGIPAEDLPRIWDRLYRGDKSRSQRGLGLGLSFVKAIAQAHHGSVQVSSTPEGGSTFTLSLPLFSL
jgi:signal transduction histidine kinase